MLLFLLLTTILAASQRHVRAVAEQCHNQCSREEGDWCDQRRVVNDTVRRCAEQTRYGEPCMTKCAKQHNDAEESYTWCRTGAHLDHEWDYCSLQGRTTNGAACNNACEMRGENYYFCNTDERDESAWDYCSPPGQVVKVTYTAKHGGQECVGECGQQGEEYWWCKKSIKFSTGKVNDPDWEYCSPDSTRTRYNKPCLDECASRGEDYFWCNTEGGSWDYCSPRAPSQLVSPEITTSGRRCAGICDRMGEDYTWCAVVGLSIDWWDYCGQGGQE